LYPRLRRGIEETISFKTCLRQVLNEIVSSMLFGKVLRETVSSVPAAGFE